MLSRVNSTTPSCTAVSSSICIVSVAHPGFAKGRADRGERAEREPKRGSGGRAPGGGSGVSPEAESFLYFLYKSGQKLRI